MCFTMTGVYATVLVLVKGVHLSWLAGLQYIKQLCVPEFNSVEMEVGTK